MATIDTIRAAGGQYVSFVINKEIYGVPILSVREIIRHQQLTRIPKSAEYIEGVLNLRGKVIPVFNLRKKFGLTETEMDNSTRIVVVEVGSKVIGMIVDHVSEVLEIKQESIDPPPLVGSDVDIDFISGMGKLEEKLIILLDINRILSAEETMMADAVQENR